jgi:ArsR family transcriptional regulator
MDLATRPLADTAEVLRALADPTRLAIAATLARETSALCVCHIEARFALSQPTISHHLRALRLARIVTTERRGTWIYYALDRARVDAVPGLSALLASVVTTTARDAKACCT